MTLSAKELMIGDWVLYNGRPRQVRYINDRVWWDGRFHNDEIGFTHREEEWIHVSHAVHVPLEDKVLRVNEFKKGSGSVYEYKVLNPNETLKIRVRVTLMKDGVHLLEIINYNGERVEPRHHGVVSAVHELQQALRLCRLTDLADGFKTCQ